ncbi:hypothetical protein [Micromonospora orduensis]|uniref:hypothetical protein n=1 Tax=Micromonospora orduensis TaxID=1420891 RepID=UPI0026BA5987
MFAAYVAVTILASVFTGIAATTYLIGHAYPKAQADSPPPASCCTSSAPSSRTCAWVPANSSDGPSSSPPPWPRWR